MLQVKTYSDIRLDGMCGFCGAYPNTRDHVPSRVFLDKPFPENLPVIPACSNCNNNFSLDEEYVACLLECALCGTTEPEKLSRPKIKKNLSQKKKLRTMLEEAKIIKDKDVFFQADEKRVKNVILKLAQGHARFENADSQLDKPYSILFQPITAMSEKNKDEFFSNQNLALAPEVGSRALQYVLMHTEKGPLTFWQTVQPKNYSYSVYHTKNGLTVKILIWEYLACEVTWH